MGTLHEVFVSYANEQRSIAEEVIQALRTRGNDVFFDRDTLDPGVEYGTAIQKAIETCDLFVFLISPDALRDRKYARTELKFAKERWKNPSGKILPVMVRPTLDSRIDPYLRAVTILYPQGNVAAEVAARATALLEHKELEPLDVPPSPELQRERIARYKELWRLTKLLPKWPRSKDVTYEDFSKFSQLLRDWYFNEGGHIPVANGTYRLCGTAGLSDGNPCRTAFWRYY